MNKKLEDFFKKQDEGNDVDNNITANVIKKIKNTPPMKRAMIANFLINGFYIFCIVIIVLIVMSIPDAALNVMRGVVEDFVEGIKDFDESWDNFISGYGFQSNEKLQEKYEEKYYRKLYDVYKYYGYTGEYSHHHKYQVEVNTTLITATLFYDRAGGDLGTDCEVTGGGNCNLEGGEGEFTGDDVKFYKNAISKIEVLARMMIVKNELFYDCKGKSTKDEIMPDDIKKLVESYKARKWYQFWKRDVDQFATRTFKFGIKENTEAEFPSYKMCSMLEYGKGEKSDRDEIMDRIKQTDAYIMDYLPALAEFKEMVQCLDDGGSDCGDTAEITNYLTVAENMVKANPTLGKFIDFNKNTHEMEFKCPEGFYTKDPNDDTHEICQQDEPLESPIFTSEWYQYGYYYYNLMNRMEDEQSFIEKYYPVYVDAPDRDAAQLEIVEGIWNYYNSFINNMGIYENDYERGLAFPVKFSGYSTVFMDGLGGTYGIIGGGPYATWVQFAGPWAELPMYDKTLHKVGCAFLSVSILIAKAHEEVGLDVSMVQPEFNPGNFLAVYKAAGGYRGTNSIAWNLYNVIPGFVYLGQNRTGDFNWIIQQIAQGHYCVIHVNNRGPNEYNHYVAAAGVVNGEIYVYDPGRTHTGALPLKSLYRWGVKTNQVICYSATGS